MQQAARRWGERDDGQITLLIIGFAVVVLLLVTVIANVSKAFVWRRSISSWADAAALAASQSVGEGGVYESGLTATLPVSEEDAVAAVDQFIIDNGVAENFPALRRGVKVDRTTGTIQVTLTSTMPLVFVNVISDEFTDGVTVVGTASSVAPLE
jgi:putative Flp pilus-assembly TadE/G-like protein